MKDIVIGISLLFVIPSCIKFWIWFIHLEKTSQIDLREDKK